MVVGDISTGTEVVVIGGGPGGYAAAIRAGQLDLDVTLVEREAYGGTCLNHGCIPSKALISAADLGHRAANAEDMGIHADPTVDFSTMIGWKDRIVRRLTAGVERLCEANDVHLVEGTAAFVDEETVRVFDEEGGRGAESIAFEHAIIATGSRPVRLPDVSFEDEGIIDARQALELPSRPDSLVIVGAGYIGMELAGAFAKLGTDVQVVELLERPLVRYPASLVDPVVDRGEELGISFAFEREVTGWFRDDDAIVVEAGDEQFAGDRVLVAAGREPVADTVDREAVDLDTDEHGAIPTNERQETAIGDVYAVGDVTGDPMLAHVGIAEGIVASEAISGRPAAFDHRAVPEVVFSDPELAVVGMSVDEADAAGHTPTVGEFPFRASGRAMTTGQVDGLVRIVGDEHERVLGGAVVGPEASELIGEIGLAMELGATFEDVARTIHPHPTLGEAVMEAAAHGRGEAIHRRNT